MSDLSILTIGSPSITDDSSSVHWFNVPGMLTKECTLANNFLLALQKLTDLEAGAPLFLHMANGPMTVLDSVEHAPAEIAELNNRGIHIFLYEPLCSYVPGEPFNNKFYSDFLSDQTGIRAIELDSIESYATRNKLTNLSVHSCDYNIDLYYDYPGLILKYDDLLLKSVFVPANLIADSISPDFNKKFICVNWRFTRVRYLISAYLSTRETHLSWCYSVTPEQLILWFDIHSWQQSDPVIYETLMRNLDNLRRIVPVVLDISVKSRDISHPLSFYYPVNSYESPLTMQSNSLEKYYRDAFVSVVNESRYAQPTANYSEKTIQAIMYHKPFIIVAPPKTLSCIRESGFRTFSDFWDESYDDCMNHEDRLIKIFKLIDWIDSKSIDELRVMYLSMQEIVKHNYQVLVTK